MDKTSSEVPRESHVLARARARATNYVHSQSKGSGWIRAALQTPEFRDSDLRVSRNVAFENDYVCINANAFCP